MATKNSDWDVIGPGDTSLISCATKWDCVDLIDRTIVRGAKTFTYCGTNPRTRRLLAVSNASPQPGTGTIRGPEEELAELLEDFEGSNCPLWFQLVSCDGEVKHYTSVYLGDQSSVNSLSANGPDATDAVLIDDISITFDRIVKLKAPDKVPLGDFLAEGGFVEDELAVGTVDGSNVFFRIEGYPLEDFPVHLKLDDTELTEDVDYTITDRNITMVVPPECGQVITVCYYTEEYLIEGLCPVAVVFCADECADTRNNCETCNTVYALYESQFASDPDVCGNDSGNLAAVAQFNFDSGTVTLENVELQENIINPRDMICADGTLVIAAENGIFEGCSGGTFSKASTNRIPSGAIINKLDFDEESKKVYAQYNVSGVLVRSRAGMWNVALADLRLTPEQQNDIAAIGDVVVTVGDANTVQVSSNAGLSWTLRAGAETAEYDITAVAIGKSNDPADSRTLLGTLSSNTSETLMHVSEDEAENWSDQRKRWAFVPTHQPQLELFEDWLFYVQIGGELWRNHNRGCDRCGAWIQLTDLEYDCVEFAYCPFDPNKIVQVYQPLIAALPDNGQMNGATGTIETFPVTDNDFSNDEDCPLDTGTLTVVSVSEPSDFTATVVGTDIQVEVVDPVGIESGTVGYVEYTIETTCGDVLRAVLVVNFLA